MKYASFSLWGNESIYNIGILKNVELVKQYYENWKMIVYYDNSVPKETINKLNELGVLTENVTELNLYGMFWRFLAADIDDCEYAIFRDADSRISLREKLAVEEWIDSGKTLHVMRDHPYHMIPAGNNQLGILGGMWGIKGRKIPITEMIKKFPKSKEKNYGNDQSFLKTIYSIFSDDKITHDEFFEKIKFPIERESGRFIGERIDENDNPVTEDYKILI